MPSPFPGMDPYLEGVLWTNFHTQLAVGIAQELNPRLAPRYVAVTEKYHAIQVFKPSDKKPARSQTTEHGKERVKFPCREPLCSWPGQCH
jgi:Protein of unknown function (DUF4058)